MGQDIAHLQISAFCNEKNLAKQFPVSLQNHLFSTALVAWLLPDVREGFQFLLRHAIMELRRWSIFL